MPYLKEDRSYSLLIALDRLFMLKTMRDFKYPFASRHYHINANLQGEYFWMDQLSIDDFSTHIATVIEDYDVDFLEVTPTMCDYFEEGNIVCVIRLHFVEQMINDLHFREHQEIFNLLRSIEIAITRNSEASCEFGFPDSPYNKDEYTFVIYEDNTYINHTVYGRALKSFIEAFHLLLEVYKEKYGVYPLAKEESSDAIS